jgi:hypothetical protein
MTPTGYAFSWALDGGGSIAAAPRTDLFSQVGRERTGASAGGIPEPLIKKKRKLAKPPEPPAKVSEKMGR